MPLKCIFCDRMVLRTLTSCPHWEQISYIFYLHVSHSEYALILIFSAFCIYANELPLQTAAYYNGSK